MNETRMGHWLDLGIFLVATLAYWTLIRTVQLVFSYFVLGYIFSANHTRLTFSEQITVVASFLASLLIVFLLVRKPWQNLYLRANGYSSLRKNMQRIYLVAWAGFALTSPVGLGLSALSIAQNVSL